jgi:hypothetical protein
VTTSVETAASSEPAPVSARGGTTRRDLWLQLAAVAIAAVALLWINRDQWFLADEWNYLVDRKLVGGNGALGIWDAHNSHLAVTVTLVNRALFSVFGVRTYLPYLLVMIGAQLVVMHLLWRLMLRLGIAATLATLASLAFALLGHGFEITTGAVGMQNAGALAFGLGALLVMPQTGPFVRRDLVVWALALASLLTSSGVAIPLVLVVGLVALVRRGWRPALALVALPAAAFAVWYALHGEQATKAQGALGTGKAIRGMPTFVAHGLWWALQNLFDLGGGGPLILLGAVVLVAVTFRWREAAWQVASCLAVGAVVYLAFTTLGRGGYGIGVADDSRYAYIVIALVLPILTLAVDRLSRRASSGPTIALVLFAALVVLQVTVLTRHADESGPIEQETKRRIVAAAEILRDPDAVALGQPVPEFEPTLFASKLRRLDRNGDLPGNVHPSPRDLLTARLYLQVATSQPRPLEPPPQATIVGGVAVEADAQGCATTGPLARGDAVLLRFPRTGSVLVDTARLKRELELQLQDGGTRSRVRRASFPGIRQLLLSDVATEQTLRVGVRQRGTSLRFCGVTIDQT